MQEESLSLFGNLNYQLFDLVSLPLGTYFKDRREKNKCCMYKVICSSIIQSSKNWKRLMISQNRLVTQIMAHQINEILSSYK